MPEPTPTRDLAARLHHYATTSLPGIVLSKQDAQKLADVLEAARLFVKDVEDYYDDDVDYVAWSSYRQLKAAFGADPQPAAGEERERG